MAIPHHSSNSFFVHPEGKAESKNIGPRTRIWAFAHVLPGAQIGADCNICDHTFIENDVVIGDRVTLKCGVQLWDGVRLEDDVFVGPNATFTNDRFPRSGKTPDRFARTLVRRGASIGANATLLPGVTVGSHSIVGAGAVVTRDIPARAVAVGNPARVIRYIDTTAEISNTSSGEFRPEAHREKIALVGGAQLYELPRIHDARGELSFAQVGQHLPFSVARYFLVFGVPSREVRGEHAHRRLQQFLVCVHGSVSVRVFDGERSAEIQLDRPNLGLFVPPMLWTTQYRYSSDAVLLVLASEQYQEEDYIRDLDEYLNVMCRSDVGVRIAGDRDIHRQSTSRS